MHDDTIDRLNETYSLGGRARFAAGPGGLPVAHLEGPQGMAMVSLWGGQVLEYQPPGEAPVLWLSELSRFQPGKPIRGGIPVCWPWFGDHPSDPALPAHGFARTARWSVLGTGAGGTHTRLVLGLRDDPSTQGLWPHPFAAELEVVLGPALELALRVENTGSRPFTMSAALHSYFAVGDATRARIHGLDGCTYADKVDGLLRKVQEGPIRLEAETDRVFLETEADCVIEDPALDRNIRVAKSGSRSTVVWNPWQAKAAAMADMTGQDYLRMACVETANALDDAVTVAPGGTHCLRASISVER